VEIGFGKKEKGLRLVAVSPFEVPETGLEPALPLLKPGSKPGFSANWPYRRDIHVMLQSLK
jgi:hypothetical protein